MAVQSGVPASEFNMWRAVFAFSLVDRVLSVEEQSLLSGYLSSIPFSAEQKDILLHDFKSPQDVEHHFNSITEGKDRSRFCELARTLVWSKGDMDLQEKIILRRVKCLGNREGRSMLKESRTSKWVLDWTDRYEQAGILGMMKHPNIYQAVV
jgi:hypothetical protein